MNQTNKRKGKYRFRVPSAYTVLLGLMIVIALVTQFVPAVKNAQFSDLIMAPINGMVGVQDVALNGAIRAAMSESGVEAALAVLKEADGPLISVWNQGQLRGAIDVSLFVLIMGGFLGVVSKTGALDAGVAALVKRLKGKELLLIPVLMIALSLGGSSFGMAEETLAFYALITVTMMKAGFDPLVSTATVMLGAGIGVLGSTVNPFAIGTAISASETAGVPINQGLIIAIGVLLWFVPLTIAILYIMRYAKKVQKNPQSTLLSAEEMAEAKATFLGKQKSQGEALVLTPKRQLTLMLFALSFVVMVAGVIPWSDFGVTIFETTTAWFNGSPLGWWWFPELTIWFFVMAIIVGLVYRLSEKELVSSFVTGASEMVGVAFIIGISRGISFMMANTGLDLYILDQAATFLSGISGALFTNIAYVIYIGLTFLIPSTSGLASVSMPIFAPLAYRLDITPELVISAFAAGAGIVNLVTPTSGVVMGGLAITKVNYGTWLKFMSKLLVLIFVASVVILSIASLIL